MNMHKQDYIFQSNRWFPEIKEYLKDFKHDKIIEYSVAYEKELIELAGHDKKEREEAELIMDSENKNVKSKVGTIVKSGFDRLRLN